MLLYYPQIIQTKGSYSFLLCGMIIACVGFILFIGLLLFHRMHRNYLAGTLSDNSLIHCCWTFSSYYSFITHPPPFQLHLHPNRNNKKICHGGGTNCRAEWICPHRTERGEHEQLRAAESSSTCLLSFTGFCRLWTICQPRLETSYHCLPNEHCADILWRIWICVLFYIASGFECSNNYDHV